MSVGDAVAVVALLGFIVGWVALWVWGGDWKRLSEGDDDVALAVALLIIVTIIVCPCLWAAALIRRIIEG